MKLVGKLTDKIGSMDMDAKITLECDILLAFKGDTPIFIGETGKLNEATMPAQSRDIYYYVRTPEDETKIQAKEEKVEKFLSDLLERVGVANKLAREKRAEYAAQEVKRKKEADEWSARIEAEGKKNADRDDAIKKANETGVPVPTPAESELDNDDDDEEEPEDDEQEPAETPKKKRGNK